MRSLVIGAFPLTSFRLVSHLWFLQCLTYCILDQELYFSTKIGQLPHYWPQCNVGGWKKYDDMLGANGLW